MSGTGSPSRVSTAPGITGNLLMFNWSWKIANVGNKAGIRAVLVSWWDGTLMNVGRSSSSRALLEIVRTLLVVVILLIKL